MIAIFLYHEDLIEQNGKGEKKSMVYVSDILLKDTYCISKRKWRV